jgi:hypothetical protein
MKTYHVYWTLEAHSLIKKDAEGHTVNAPYTVVSAYSEKEALSKAWQNLGRNPVMNMICAKEV